VVCSDVLGVESELVVEYVVVVVAVEMVLGSCWSLGFVVGVVSTKDLDELLHELSIDTLFISTISLLSTWLA